MILPVQLVITFVFQYYAIQCTMYDESYATCTQHAVKVTAKQLPGMSAKRLRGREPPWLTARLIFVPPRLLNLNWNSDKATVWLTRDNGQLKVCWHFSANDPCCPQVLLFVCMFWRLWGRGRSCLAISWQKFNNWHFSFPLLLCTGYHFRKIFIKLTHIYEVTQAVVKRCIWITVMPRNSRRQFTNSWSFFPPQIYHSGLLGIKHYMWANHQSEWKNKRATSWNTSIFPMRSVMLHTSVALMFTYCRNISIVATWTNTAETTAHSADDAYKQHPAHTE